ncbi:hypothetical protein [Actinomadura sp. HBU206391]|uniref:hypothetical protein n=1 Tax=Actinomadura sp. HBU206391 TaxID=2731692 RepID=UPI0016503054|nr:hypothetical protein [Actinomadura sp. HBU206391]MBC6461470.1 hypothetical protein [Actinomadura sp. HBU206391]
MFGTDTKHRLNGTEPASEGRRNRTVEIYNLRYRPAWRGASGKGDADRTTRDTAGRWLLAVASVLLLLLAVAQGYVSFRAQYAFVHEIKGEHFASMLEALGLDAAAVIFALLALAQARLGRPAVTERVLNLACVLGSLAMNALSADMSSAKSIAAWTLPAALYAAASDRLIAVVRRQALAGRPGADREGSPLAAAGSVALWTLRLALAPVTTTKGLRRWVLDEAPIAPGRRAVHGRTELPALPAPHTGPTTADTVPDAGTDTDSDTAADRAPDTPAEPPRQHRTANTTRKTGAKTGRAAARQKDKARALLTAEPTMTGAELGRRLKVSDRTGRRLHSRITTELTAAQHSNDTATDPAAPVADQGDDAR